MKSFVVFALISASAVASEFHCQGTLNYELTMDAQVTLAAGAKNVPVGNIGDLEVFLSTVDNGSIELQTYNPIEPSRTYAQAKGNNVKLISWKRESITEVECKLSKP
jgi:hypothetical protein